MDVGEAACKPVGHGNVCERMVKNMSKICRGLKKVTSKIY